MQTDVDEIIDKIFNKVLYGPQVFIDKSILFHDYVPKRLPFREDHIARVGYLVSTLIRGQRSSNLFIYGKPGTGKTAVTRFVVNKLLEKSNEVGRSIHESFINCRLAGTEYRVASALARDVGLDIPFTGLAVREVFQRFREKILLEGQPIMIVLDEVDSLVSRYGDDLLYGITRINDEDRRTNIMLLGISNDIRFKEYLDPRVLSSLSEEEIIFKPYSSKELERILWDRVPHAFRKDTITQDVVSLCAAISGAEHGDARKALDLLRVAGELAENDGRSVIDIEHVHNARERIEQNRAVEVVRSLPLHSKLVLMAIVNSSSKIGRRVKSSVAYALYSEYAKEFAGHILSTRRFYGLVRELSVLGLLDRKIENYGRRGGRMTTIALDIPEKMVREALTGDVVIGEIFK